MTREELISYVLGLSDQTLIAAIAIVLVLLLGLIWFVVSKQRLSRRIRLASEDENAADAVVRRLKEHPTPRLCRHALEQIPDRALFTVFRAAIGKTRSAEELLRWMDESDDFFVYRRLALSGSGESFDGAKALELFSDHLDRIREMTGDPEWPARYFAVKILIHDSDERSKRTVREMWDDSHTLIRRTLI